MSPAAQDPNWNPCTDLQAQVAPMLRPCAAPECSMPDWQSCVHAAKGDTPAWSTQCDRQPERTGPRLPHPPEAGCHRVSPHRHGHAGGAHLHAPAVRALPLVHMAASSTYLSLLPELLDITAIFKHWQPGPAWVVPKEEKNNKSHIKQLLLRAAALFGAGTSSSRPMWWWRARLSPATSRASRWGFCQAQADLC